MFPILSLKKARAEAQAQIMDRNPHLGDEPPLCACGKPCFAVQPIGPAFWTGRCGDCIRDGINSS